MNIPREFPKWREAECLEVDGQCEHSRVQIYCQSISIFNNDQRVRMMFLEWFLKQQQQGEAFYFEKRHSWQVREVLACREVDAAFIYLF